jgi:plastocyanin
MNLRLRFQSPLERAGLSVLLGAGLLGRWPAAGATANVSVGDFFFNPSSVSIHVGDQVKWTWTGNINHTATSTGGLWNSGLQGKGATFSTTFSSAGSFPYYCIPHPSSMRGTVTVAAAANQSPTVALTAPAGGAVVSAPWTSVIHASASDPDGTVTNLSFFAGTTLLGSVRNPPANASLNVANVMAGNYSLTAVATDNAGARTTSAGVALTVVNAVPLVLSAPRRLSPNSFAFSYTANPGLSYRVRRSTDLKLWTILSTNVAAAATVSYTDTTATGKVQAYSVQLLPNP